MNERPARPRGCLGCSLGCLTTLALMIVLGTLAFALIDLAFAPWIYIVGGRHRWLPVWQGVGDVQTSSGRYRIYVWFSPAPSGSRILAATDVRGNGILCTPKGERFTVRVTGGTAGHIWKEMDGHEFHLSVYHRPWYWSFSGDKGWQPRLTLSGHWVGPNLAMSDHGSLSRAFLADGTLNLRNSGTSDEAKAVNVTLNELAWWNFSPVSCPR